MKTLKLKITLTCWDKELVWRLIEVPENKTLHQLHLAIQKAFGWYNDHLYSFFMNSNRRDKSTEYTSPIDIEESDGAMAATKVKLKELSLSVKKKFLYIYDFGDNLDCEIEVVGFGQIDKDHTYPQLIGAFGGAPEQYAIRRFEEDEDEEEDEYFDDCGVCQGLKEMGLKHESIDMKTGKVVSPKAKKQKKLSHKHDGSEVN